MKRSELKEMIRRIVKEKKKAIEEARINPVGIGKILPPKYEKPIEILFDGYEGRSGFNLYKPVEVNMDYKLGYDDDDEEIYEDPNYIFAKEFTTQHPYKIFVSNNVYKGFKCPGAPPGSFQACIIIDQTDISLYTPDVDRDGKYSVGWFDINGNYYPDTKNFDEDGEYIGDSDNA
jgi:hypothetical protein